MIRRASVERYSSYVTIGYWSAKTLPLIVQRTCPNRQSRLPAFLLLTILHVYSKKVLAIFLEYVVGLLDDPWQIVHCQAMCTLPCQILALQIKKVSINCQKSSKDVPLVPPPFRFAVPYPPSVCPPLVRLNLCSLFAFQSSPASADH